MASDANNKITIADSQPPKIYIPACGALCDIFWWARRDVPAAPAPTSTSIKPKTP